MLQNRFWNLLSKKLAGEATQDDICELESLIKEYPELVYSAEQIENLWKLAPEDSNSWDDEIAFQKHLHSLQQKEGIELMYTGAPAGWYDVTGEENQDRSKKRWATLFTILVMAAVGFMIWQLNIKKPADVLVHNKTFNSEVSTRMGDRIQMVLPDSTVVWLNAGSKLNYNEKFGITNRNLNLSGEAYFDVRKSRIPFIIQANGVQIKVLGTAFNVKSYPNEKTTETSLLRGEVEITIRERPGEKFLLKPNEKLIVANDIKIKEELPGKRTEPMVVLSSLTHTVDNSIVETSWVDNKFIFQDESFAELAIKMERWFGVDIAFAGESIEKERLSGTFTKETIQEALDILQMTTSFKYSIKSDSIVITE